jgi:CTP:molybdopterin cytidylyltransferase MocA
MENNTPLILLAGGSSSRMGVVAKGLQEVEGKPWLKTQCDDFRRNTDPDNTPRIILVLGYRADEYLKLASSIPGLIVVMNPEPENGPFSSIQAGVRRALEPDFQGIRGAYVLPIDVPVAKKEVWSALFAALSEGARVAQPVIEGREGTHGGHPVLLSLEEMRVLTTLKSTDRLDQHLHALDTLAPGQLKRVKVSDPTILANLNTPEDWAQYFGSKGDTELIGKAAALLSLVEVGLGSALHAFHLPLSGHFLSLNQAFWLTRATRQVPRDPTAPLTISNIAATLKSLSPAGKKLTPMLAISAQGALFNLGTAVFGRNILGSALGAAISSTWAFIQPVLIYYIIFGNTLLEAGEKLYQRCQEVFHFSEDQALLFISLILIVKALLGVLAAGLAWVLPERKINRYQDRLVSLARKTSVSPVTSTSQSGSLSSVARGAAFDLFRPLFFISLLLTMIFFYWAESSKATLIWMLIRPVAVGFVLFFTIRILPTEKILSKIESAGFRRFSTALRIAKQSLGSR